MSESAQGTTIEVDISATLTNIAKPVDIGEIGETVPLVDSSHLQSVQKEYIGGLADGDEIAIQFRRVSNDPGQEHLRNNAGSTETFQVTFGSTGDTADFDAVVTRAAVGGMTVDGVLAFNATLKISGGITWTET